MTRPFLLALVLLPACASAPSAPAPAPVPAGRTLAYAVTAPSTVSYSFADTSAIDIQGGAIGDIHVKVGAAGIADVTFAAKGADVEAMIRVTQFAGSMSNSAMGTAPSATEKEIGGPAVVTVSARGAPTITAMPTLTPVIQQVGVSQAFFRRFFVRLPAAQVAAGAMWVDTVMATDSAGGTKATYRDITTSPFVRDSVVSGRKLAYITTTTQRTLKVTGASQGVEIVQNLSGTAASTALWDTDRKLLVDRVERTDLSGTFDLPAMGVTGLPVTARGTGHLALR